MSEWKSIESAPKDGTRILVADEDGDVCEVSWWDSWYKDKSKPGWMLANCDEEYGYYVRPKFWMPLPSPPISEEGE